jgi:HipA-like protein
VADRRPAQLHVCMRGRTVATLTEQRPRGPIQLVHPEHALSEWGFNLPVVFCSLPTTDEPQDATTFLDGFLPEGQIRNALAAARDVVASDTWMLLAAFGRDIAGAMAVTDPDRPAGDRAPGTVAYDDDGLAGAVEALPARPLDVHDDSELSLAGVQHKMLLVATDDGWSRPVGGLPSTHILEPEPPAHAGLVALEAEALSLARTVGLTTVSPRSSTSGDAPACSWTATTGAAGTTATSCGYTRKTCVRRPDATPRPTAGVASTNATAVPASCMPPSCSGATPPTLPPRSTGSPAPWSSPS